MSNPILIQAAMEEEMQEFIRILPPKKEEILGKYHFYHCEFQGYPVIISRTGIGMCNASIATTLAITLFHPAIIINQGLAGAHSEELHRGDIVLGERCIAINSFEKPLEKSGIHYEKWLDSNFYTDDKVHYGNSHLVSLFDDLKYEKGRKIRGVLGSGDVWNREWDFIRWLHANLGSSTEDMETLAVYVAAEAFDIPVVGLRIISNNELTEEEYAPETATTLQNFILDAMPQLVQLAEGVLHP